jgi:hypothetical protein
MASIFGISILIAGGFFAVISLTITFITAAAKLSNSEDLRRVTLMILQTLSHLTARRHRSGRA